MIGYITLYYLTISSYIQMENSFNSASLIQLLHFPWNFVQLFFLAIHDVFFFIFKACCIVCSIIKSIIALKLCGGFQLLLFSLLLYRVKLCLSISLQEQQKMQIQDIHQFTKKRHIFSSQTFVVGVCRLEKLLKIASEEVAKLLLLNLYNTQTSYHKIFKIQTLPHMEVHTFILYSMDEFNVKELSEYKSNLSIDIS